jgi:phosphatidylglycerophosphatase A
VDEFAGQAIALVAIPRDPLSLIAAFLWFRVFDTFKFGWVKKHVESIKGGWGVTLDDTIAGIIARVLMIPTIILLGYFSLL